MIMSRIDALAASRRVDAKAQGKAKGNLASEGRFKEDHCHIVRSPHNGQ